jgi:hypothetical protein
MEAFTKTKIVVLDIEIPKEVEENAHGINENYHLLAPEDIEEYPDMCCGDFQGAFGQYLRGQLCSDSIYRGVKVKMKVGNGEPVWVTMNTEGPPEHVKIPKKYKIFKRKELELPELEIW